MSGATLAPGRILIDRYRIERYINAGGMQEVYLAQDLKLGRHAVVKTPKDGATDKRFKRGAEMSARINHHNIAATFDYYEGSDITFMVEEFIDGVDLGQRLQREFYGLDPALAAHVVHNIAKALLEAHRSGICHRDLKPSNIMTSSDPNLASIKLTDFGIAKLAENEIEEEMKAFEKDESTLTSSNTLLGAVPYMAPECWSNWRGAGQAMDVWALGCIAYQLLSGELPFGSGRAAIMAVAKLEASGVITLKEPALMGRKVIFEPMEQDLWRLIRACLVIDPDKRPSAKDVVEMCAQWCYESSPRRVGEIESYGVRYSSGGKSKTGMIKDLVSDERFHYHLSEYYGTGTPTKGMKVSVGVHPGAPRRRAAPILPLK